MSAPYVRLIISASLHFGARFGDRMVWLECVEEFVQCLGTNMAELTDAKEGSGKQAVIKKRLPTKVRCYLNLTYS